MRLLNKIAIAASLMAALLFPAVSHAQSLGLWTLKSNSLVPVLSTWGVNLSSSSGTTTLASTYIGSVNGLGAPTWYQDGTALYPISAADGPTVGEPSVIIESNSQLIPGLDPSFQIFKMWYDTQSSIRYAESQDGINFREQAANVLNNHGRVDVLHIGSTYYMVTRSYDAASATNGDLDLYTSTDGVTVSLNTAGIIATSSNTTTQFGAPKKYEDTSIENSSTIYDPSDGLFHIFYEAAGSGTQTYTLSMATSTSMSGPWNKYVNNPVLSGGKSSDGSVITAGSPSVHIVNGQYWMWAHTQGEGSEPNTMNHPGEISDNQTKITSWYSNDKGMTWKCGTGTDSTGKCRAIVMPAGLAATSPCSQVADPNVVESTTTGVVYMYYSATQSALSGGNCPGNLNGLSNYYPFSGYDTIERITARMPLSEVVKTGQGMVRNNNYAQPMFNNDIHALNYPYGVLVNDWTVPTTTPFAFSVKGTESIQRQDITATSGVLFQFLGTDTAGNHNGATGFVQRLTFNFADNKHMSLCDKDYDTSSGANGLEFMTASGYFALGATHCNNDNGTAPFQIHNVVVPDSFERSNTLPGADLWIDTGGVSIGPEAGTYRTAVPPANGLIMAGRLGIGSTSPSYQFSVGSTTAAAVDVFSVDSAGNQYGGGGKPSVSCASTCTLDANAHDSSGTIFISGVQTSVTLTFYASKPWAPHCVASDNVTTGNYDASSTLTTVVFTTTASLGTASIGYHCQL